MIIIDYTIVIDYAFLPYLYNLIYKKFKLNRLYLSIHLENEWKALFVFV